MLGGNLEVLKFRPQRTFGVELEWGRGLSRARMKTVIQSFPNERAIATGYQHNSNPELWYCKTDSSCGYEVASRVLGSMDSIQKTLEDLKRLEEVHLALYNAGARTTTSCGMHVHLGLNDLDNGQFYRFLSYWVKFEKFILDMMPNRRKSNHYCATHSIDFSPNENYRSERVLGSFNGRRAVNIGGWIRRRCIEIRLAEGTNDPRNSKNWVRFLLHFVDQVKNLPDPDNVNWVGLQKGLEILSLYSPGDQPIVLSPALSEMRHWILARTKSYANARDGQERRDEATHLEETLYPHKYGEEE